MFYREHESKSSALWWCDKSDFVPADWCLLMCYRACTDVSARLFACVCVPLTLIFYSCAPSQMMSKPSNNWYRCLQNWTRAKRDTKHTLSSFVLNIHKKAEPHDDALLTFAPCSIRSLAHATLPCIHAPWRGETWSRVLRFTHVPCKQCI